MEMSVKTIVIIALSVMGIILGFLLLMKVFGIKEALPIISLSDRLSVKVTPESSQVGTSFLINAVYSQKREQQDLNLIIESPSYSGLVNLYDDGLHYDKSANDGLYGGFFDSTDKPLGNYEIKNNENILTNFKVYESNCEFIEGVPDEDKINFVILPSGYNDYEDFKEDAEDLLNCKNCLLNTEPFNSNKNKFSFSIVNTSVDCEVGCHEVDTIVCCDNSEVVRKASQCHSDSIYVLVNDNEECGSSSSFAKVCSKSFYANRILMHELGHSFADLADEYVYSDFYGDYDIGEINNINCDSSSNCEKWEDITSKCYKGCTYSNLYRSVKDNSVMLDLYPEFNLVCREHVEDLIQEHEIKEREIDKLTPKISKSYFVDLKYDKGDIEIKSVYLAPVKAGADMKKSDYNVKINNNDEEVFSADLYIPNIIYPFANSSSPIVLDSVDFSVVLPYSKDADNLVVYKEEKPLTKVFLPFADKCGNNVCDDGENHLNCADCNVNEDDFCETSKCDTDCESQKNCDIKSKIFFPFGIGLIIFGFLLIFFIIRKTKN